MSPSAEQIELRIGRNLKQRDVLRSQDQSLEVLNPEVPAGEGYFEGLYGKTMFSVPTVEVRELTPQGPGTETAFVPRNDESAFTDVVPREKRTDIGFLERLKYKLRR